MGTICDSKKNIVKIGQEKPKQDNNIFNLNYICLISSPIKGIGFFLKIDIDNKPFYCIITNIEFNKKELLDLNENIEVYFNGLQNKFIINLKEKKRFLRFYKDINTTVIQILLNIDINSAQENYFFSPRTTYEDFVGKKIDITQISEDNKYNIFKGEIKKINENLFTHSANVKNGFLGNFIILENTYEFIGINLERKTDENENYGYFLSKIKNLLMPKKIIILDNKNYYEGEIVNGKMHGKGKMYYKNKKIMYDGDFVDNKFEGNGKLIFENDVYYVGQFLRGERYGKGTMHEKNGSITYEGDFCNDKMEGNGKYIYENGDYYIGQFMDDKRHGKGKMYYKNGVLWYEGDFMNDKIEGEGKYIFDNGDYYIGQFENGIKKGNGKEFYKNKKMRYDGSFNDDLYEGNGTFIYDDNEYYIGQWHKGLKEGKGILYYKNKTIKYDGNYINDKYEGKGKYIYENGDYFIGNWSNGVKQGKGTEYYQNGNIINSI